MYVLYQVFATYKRVAAGHWCLPDRIDQLEGAIPRRCSDCLWIVPGTVDPED